VLGQPAPPGVRDRIWDGLERLDPASPQPVLAQREEELADREAERRGEDERDLEGA